MVVTTRNGQGYHVCRVFGARVLVLFCSLLCLFSPSATAVDDAGEILFDAKILPMMKQHCFECHSHAKSIKGGLALDSRAGLMRGGESGPVVEPGNAEQSRIIAAIRHMDAGLQMPPDRKLKDEEIAAFVEWVNLGASDTRPLENGAVLTRDSESDEWEALYHERLSWWSLQPVKPSAPPAVTNQSWPRNEIDRFILARLDDAGLTPAEQAPKRVLARRLSYALIGLPPSPEEVERFVADNSPEAYETYVHTLLNSPHFGERWARHWMDVVHYSDTHGYEWDTPAKNAWMYRDYLIRAFNDDVPFDRLILEQIAGDLIEPRIDESGVNQSLVGPMAMRLGERRHGDNADAEGVTQEAVQNIIDTLSKGFLATTVACAQCHDHKLDAVAQKDYFGMSGVFTSSRWYVRTVDTTDPNMRAISELQGIKRELRALLGDTWRGAHDHMLERILHPPTPAENSKPTEAKAAPKQAVPKPWTFPESIPALWQYLNYAVANDIPYESAWDELVSNYPGERKKRILSNKANLRLIADFTSESLPHGWQIDGFGLTHGLVADGELVVTTDGDAIVHHVLPAGRWTHVWSPRLAGAVRSPLFAQNPAPTFSVGFAGGQHAAQSLIVENAFHSERMKFLSQPVHGWMTLSAGNLTALAGGADDTPRRVYLEMVTKSLNNYFPPRTMYGGVKEADEKDPRSWFGITRVYEHATGQGPMDELARFESIFTGPAPTRVELASRLVALVLSAVEHWHQDTCDGDDVRIINEALSAGWIPNDIALMPSAEPILERYRAVEKTIVPERVVGSVSDWNEGRDERIGIRGSYTAFGEESPRGTIRFLGGPGLRAFQQSSGRLEFARGIASDQNPLTARVFVNRVWHYLFGSGLVRSVDDFGHLGEPPSHPELLDWLATRFVEDGWSLKKLIALLVTSSTWRQSSVASEHGQAMDPENRLWHHMPMRRLDAEAIRDALLTASGRLERTLYGEPIEPFRVAQDPAKRLAIGPLDGNGRRSIYLEMTLMEPPKFLALFNQPIPKLTTGKRDSTNVPDQALALMNDPFVVAMAKHWSDHVMDDGSATPEQRIDKMFRIGLSRPPLPEELSRFVSFAYQAATLRGADTGTMLSCQPVWQDVAHAMFNMKEFIYVQ
ncbi:MAG: hypothetical protein AMXMBFR84_45200 [Candidatus Hydrogenedentota bacterium]